MKFTVTYEVELEDTLVEKYNNNKYINHEKETFEDWICNLYYALGWRDFVRDFDGKKDKEEIKILFDKKYLKEIEERTKKA